MAARPTACLRKRLLCKMSSLYLLAFGPVKDPLASKRIRPRVNAALALLAMASLAACSKEAPFNFLKPVGTAAKKADQLWDLTFAIATVIFVLVEGALLFIVLRFRHRPDRKMPKQTHGNTRLEIVWTIIPVLLLTGVAFPTVRGIAGIYSAAPEDALDVKVIAHQWWWEFQYENGGPITANELHIPVNTEVDLELHSNDVIHSFWVPKLAGKQDLVPGRVNHLKIDSPVTGEFLGQCAEYCGLSHANMRFKVIVHDQQGYEDWLASESAEASEPSGGLALRGQTLFLEGQCAGCHTVGGTDAAGMVGPNLTHFASREKFAGWIFDRTDEEVAAWLRDPPARKPGSLMPDLGLSEEDIQALVAYLQSLE